MRIRSSEGHAKEFMLRSLIVIFIFIFVLIWVGFSAAGNVSIEKARRVAQNWLYSSQFNKILASKSSPEIIGEEVMQYGKHIAGYNFLLFPKGHIIVPAKDELPVVKLYSYTTRLNTADGSDIVQWIEEELFLLDEAIDVHAAEFATANATETPNGQLWRKFDKDPVIFSFESAIDMGTGLLSISAGPLIHTSWNQADPYNLYTPLWSDGQKTVTGCVATATAQIMKYWSYPTAGQGSTSYSWNNGSVNQTLSQDFSTSTYNWNLMTNSYGAGSTPTEKDAVARLMSDVGVAFHIKYGKAADGGSGADQFSGTTVFPTYFQYKNSIQSVARSNYASDSAWMQVFQNEVENSRPSQLRIRNTIGDKAHSVVVDGYRDTPAEQIHINLGWGGSYDGWYVSNNIVTGLDSWTDVNYQAAVIGIEPNNVVTTCQTTPMTIGGDAISGQIATTDCTSTKYGNGWYADFYTFTGSAGDKISISLDPDFYNPRMMLYGPNGLELDVWTSRIPFGSGYYTLQQTGTYTLEVTTSSAGNTGNYTLSSLSSNTIAPTPATVTPYNMSSGSFVDRPFDLKTTFTDNESTVTSCEYTINGTGWDTGVVSGTKPNFRCTKTGINGTNGQTLTLNMRATSGGGTATATAVERTVDAQPPTDGTLTLVSSNSQVLLKWTAAHDSGSGLRTTKTYKVVRKTGTTPNSKCANGTQVYLGNNNSVVDSDLINGTVYYYRVCAYDKVNNISKGATANMTPDWASDELTNSAGDSLNPAIAIDGENIYMVWQDDTPGNPEIYFRMSTDGGYTWAAAKRLTNNTGNSANPAIAVNGQNIYVVWQNDTIGNPNMSDIYLRMSTDGGNNWNTAKKLTSEPVAQIFKPLLQK